MGSAPNWAEQVTAIATSVGAIGLLAAILAAIHAGRQVREARIGREAQMAAEFFRRWNDDALVETRRLLNRFASPEELTVAFDRYVSSDAPEAYVLYRELDYFEQLGALEAVGALDFDLINVLLGPRLVDRWRMWKPSIDAIGGDEVYPMFAALAAKVEANGITAGAR